MVLEADVACPDLQAEIPSMLDQIPSVPIEILEHCNRPVCLDPKALPQRQPRARCRCRSCDENHRYRGTGTRARPSEHRPDVLDLAIQLSPAECTLAHRRSVQEQPSARFRIAGVSSRTSKPSLST
jgi:hypothetical protein